MEGFFEDAESSSSSSTGITKLFVRNIPRTANQSESSLLQTFRGSGALIDKVILITSNNGGNHFTGSAFISFEKKEDASVAKYALNDTKMTEGSGPLRVNWVETDEKKKARRTLRARTLLSEALHKIHLESDQQPVLGVSPAVEYIPTTPQLYGYGSQVTSQYYRYGSQPGELKLFVRGIPKEFHNSELIRLFEPFGKVVGAKVVFDDLTGRRRSLSYGFVVYGSKSEADKAIQHLNGFKIGDKALEVRYAEKPRFEK